MEFNPELKENIKNPEQEVRQAFADFEIDIEGIEASVLARLIEMHSEEDSHFYDAIEMAKMLDKNWEHLGLVNVDKQKMLVCALLHDVGKSGPEAASSETRKLCLWLFHKKHHIKDDVDVREMKMIDFIDSSDLENKQEAKCILAEDLALDIENLSMIDYWSKHVDWTFDILSQHLGGEVDDEVVLITASHHLLDGKNPANLKEEDLPRGSHWLEVMEEYQILTLVDKYQAFRQRSGLSHEQTIVILLKKIDQSNLSESLKDNYRKIVAKFSEPDFMSNFDIAHQEIQAKYHT